MLLVLCLEGPLHVEVELPLALDALLLHVADDSLVHRLYKVSPLVFGARHEPAERTSFSHFCWKCTKTMVQAANSDVPAKVSLDARDMAACVFFLFGVWRANALDWRVK